VSKIAALIDFISGYDQVNRLALFLWSALYYAHYGFTCIFTKLRLIICYVYNVNFLFGKLV